VTTVSAASAYGGGGDWVDLLQAEVEAALGGRSDWDTPAALAASMPDGFVMRDHLRHLSDRLAAAMERVEGGEDAYVAVSMPPRLGKSFLGSVHFPVWCLHRHPDWPLMLLSHDPTLATGWGRDIRRAVEEHGPELGLRLAPDAGAARDWEIDRDLEEYGPGRRGGAPVVARSVRESVTGKGAKVMVLDDIVKDFAEAHSPTSRQFVWDWWKANSRSRLHHPALVLVIGTRWHEDDFIGRLLSDEHEGDPGKWEVISFPALAEDPEEEDPVTGRPYGPDALGRAAGEPLLSPLAPGETREQALARWAEDREAVGTYAWNALYQQRPRPAKGSIFDNDWWGYWRPGDWDDPEGFFERRATSWDCAFKGTEDSDWVVGQEWGLRGASRYLLRQVRRRMTFTETLAEMRDFILGPVTRVLGPDDALGPGEAAYLERVDGAEARVARGPHSGAHAHVVEDKANGTAVLDVLRQEIPGMVPYSPGTNSKEARARAASPQIESGQVYLPALAEWLPDYLSEFRAFPSGAHDDQVDCTVQLLLRERDGGGVQVQSTAGAQVSRPSLGRGGAQVGRRRTSSGVGRRR